MACSEYEERIEKVEESVSRLQSEFDILENMINSMTMNMQSVIGEMSVEQEKETDLIDTELKDKINTIVKDI